MNRFLLHASFFVLFLWAHASSAQTICNQVVGSIGSIAVTPTGISFAYTVGEAIIPTGVSPSVMLTQGFHQPEICLTSAIQSIPNQPGVSLSLYPNPASKQLFLRFSEPLLRELTIQAFSLVGSADVLYQLPKGTSFFEIPIEHWPVGVHYLHFFEPGSAGTSLTVVKVEE